MEKKILREVCELVGEIRKTIQGYVNAGLVVIVFSDRRNLMIVRSNVIK